MAFQGNKFIFDGIPGEQYGLMLANINNANQDAGKIGGAWKVHEDRITRRSVGLDYGVTANDPLSFPITMVAMEDNHHFDRYDVAAVAGWLTGHQSFKQLIILQDDMENVYYRCRITQLEAVEVGMRVVGFAATVTCDGPFAYRAVTPHTTVLNTGTTPVVFVNASNVNDYLHPVISLAGVGADRDITIVNESDAGRTFRLSNLPSPTEGLERTITIDCLHQIMTASDGINLYEYWNQRFPRFVRGNNQLSVTLNRGVPYTQVIENDTTFFAISFDDLQEWQPDGEGQLICSLYQEDGQMITQSVKACTAVRPITFRFSEELFSNASAHPDDIISAKLFFMGQDYIPSQISSLPSSGRSTLTIEADALWNIGY